MNVRSFFTILVFASLLTSCEKSDTPPVAVGDPEIEIPRPQVVILGAPLPTSHRVAFDAGASARTLVDWEFAENLSTQPEAQRERMQRWAARGVDLFAVAFWNPAEAEVVLQEAGALGVPAIVFGGEAASYSGSVAARISTDPYRAGQLAGAIMIEAVAEAATPLGVVDFEYDEAIGHRLRGIEDRLGRFTRSRLEPGPTFSRTGRRVGDLAAGDSGGLFVLSDDRIAATAAALEEGSRQGSCAVIGFGARPAATEALDQGRVYAMIQPDPKALADAVLETIDRLLAEQSVDPQQWVPPVAVYSGT